MFTVKEMQPYVWLSISGLETMLYLQGNFTCWMQTLYSSFSNYGTCQIIEMTKIFEKTRFGNTGLWE